MMDAFSALMEARDPALGRFRSYRIAAGTDLFGAWLVEVTYGRIGARGRSVRYVASDEVQARKLVHRSLRRRGTAEKRIGVSYEFRELFDPAQWVTKTMARNSMLAGSHRRFSSAPLGGTDHRNPAGPEAA
jgi:hypothetical protein